MFVNYKGSILGILRWQWKAVTLYAAASTAVVLLDKFLDIEFLYLPTMPLAVIGAALGIFTSFRTNSAYDRWWEGRKLWGLLINVSRHFCTEVISYVLNKGGPNHARGDRLVRRHVAYVHTLRCLLRKQDPLKDDKVLEHLLPDEVESLRGESNMTHAILQIQANELVALCDEEVIDEFRLQSLDTTIARLLDIQGGCERIKKTPFPAGYTIMAELLVKVFAFLLPLGLVMQLHWLTVPITVMVCLAFELISEVGRVLEDPFTTFYPALPLTAMSTTIETNLRQRLGDTELPEPEPIRPPGVLM
jgi:putative membrane protein